MNDEPQHKHRKYYILALFAVFIAILGVILPETEFTPKQYINASNITVVGAAATQGSLINISDINGGYFNISEGTGSFYATVNFTNITNFSFLEVKARYFSTSVTPSTHIINLQIFCDTDQTYEDVFFMENADEWRYFTRHFPESNHFINNGNVSIRFNHAANGNVNHRLWIDTVRLITSVQYEQNIIYLTQHFNTTTSGTGGASNLSQLSIDTNKSWNAYNIYNVTIDNQSMSNKVNKTGDLMNFTGNTRLNLSYSGNTTGSYDAWDFAGISFTFFTSNRFQSKTSGWQNLSYSGRKGGSIVWADDAFGYYTFSANNVTPIPQFAVTETGVYISQSTGTGNAYLCIDSLGKVFRGSPGC